MSLQQVDYDENTVGYFAVTGKLGDSWNAWQIQQSQRICHNNKDQDRERANPTPAIPQPKQISK
jgi:thiamine monophosphate kinase